MNKLVMNFLVTEGYVEAAERFQLESGTERIHLIISELIFVRLFTYLFFTDSSLTTQQQNQQILILPGFPYWKIADIDLATITDRMAVKKAVQSGNVEDAIEKVNDLNPEVR